MNDIYEYAEKEEPEVSNERDPDYTDAGHLRELPELLDNITLEDVKTLYEDDYPWE